VALENKHIGELNQNEMAETKQTARIDVRHQTTLSELYFRDAKDDAVRGQSTVFISAGRHIAITMAAVASPAAIAD
jgi:hypothetical protein